MTQPPFPVLELLPTYPARSLRLKGQSYFEDAQGRQLPSVTTILNATKPAEDWEALKQWRDRVGAEEANRIARTASRRGSQTHKHIRSYLLGQAIACPDPVRPYWDSVAPVLSDIDRVHLVESVVVHDALSYGGRVDCVATYRGMPCVVDWKTADRPKGSVERLYDAPLQLAAYSGAVNQCYASEGMRVRHALLVVAIADQPAELFWFDAETLVQYWQQWQTRVEQFQSRFRRSSL